MLFWKMTPSPSLSGVKVGKGSYLAGPATKSGFQSLDKKTNSVTIK
jgi:hypothetical protein